MAVVVGATPTLIYDTVDSISINPADQNLGKHHNKTGGPCRVRTDDTRIKSPLLYLLS